MRQAASEGPHHHDKGHAMGGIPHVTLASTEGASPARLTLKVAAPIVVTLCAVYGISQFFRNSLGVIAPDLRAEFTLGANEIAALSSIFFLVFAAMQIPLGVGLDRFGPKLCLVVSSGVAIIGGVVFALAPDYAGLVLGRILLGIGCSAFFMAPLALYARWFAKERFSTLAGIQLGAGSIGTLIATWPLAAAVAAFGWRESFLGVAVLTVIGTFVIWLVVRDSPPGAPPRPPATETLRESFAGVGEALRIPGVWRLFAMHLTTYSTFVTVLGLWGGPYLADVYGAGLAERGTLLFVLALAQVIALFLWGPLDGLFGSYRVPVVLGAVATILLLALLAVVGRLEGVWLAVWFAAFGAAIGFTPVLMGHGRAMFPDRLVGRGITILNLATMFGAVLIQTATGFAVDLFGRTATGGYPPDAYRVCFGLMALFVAISTLIYLGAGDPRRRKS
jgi:MFS family permease